MGVIYKLKKEVVDFILEEKKRNPSISCRKLASLISKQFEIPISKSSVNSVLKAGQMSSPVGRRAETGKVVEKKPKSSPVPPQKAVLDKKPVKKKDQPANLVKKEVPPRQEKPSPEMSKQASPKKPQSFGFQPKQGKVYDGMGSYFLKAAEWLVSDSPIASTVLSQYARGLSSEEITKVSEILIYLEIFGIKDPQDIEKYKDKGLWVLNGLSEPIEHSLISKTAESISDIKGFNIEMSTEMEQALEEISYIKLLLSDSTEVFIDACFGTIFPKNVQSGISTSTQKAISLMSKQIINNLSPVIICSAPGEVEFEDTLFDLVCAFENIGKKEIAKISLIDTDDMEIAEFQAIPKQRRKFIFGVWPHQKEYAAILEEAEGLTRHRFVQKGFGRQVHYCEMLTNILNEHIREPLRPMRVFLVQEELTGDPDVMIMTNIPTAEMLSEDVISSYLLRWPNLQRGHILYLLRNVEKAATEGGFGASLPAAEFSLKETSSLRNTFHSILLELNGFCKKHFFPFHFEEKPLSAIITSIYSLPGILQEEQRKISVELILPQEQESLREDLQHAVKRLNESDVVDPQGRRLILSLSPAL